MTPKRKEKPPAKPSVDVGELFRQPHGGALRRGGTAGTTNRGGPGRPKDAFRQACRDAFNDVKGVEIVKQIAEGTYQATIGMADGVAVMGPPKHEHIARALDFLKDNGWGKAPVVVEMEQEEQGPRFKTGEAAMKWLLETTGRLLRVLAPDPEARAELLDAMVNDRDPYKRLVAKEMIQSGCTE